MDLRCPHCHKHVFPIRSVFMLGENGRYSGLNTPLECPVCGGFSKLSAYRQTLIDLLTLAAGGLVVVLMTLFIRGGSDTEIWTIIFAFGLGGVARYLAIKMLAVLVTTDGVPVDEDIHIPKESISPDRIQEELRRLKDDKKAQFTIIYSPKGEYLSLYCRKGIFVIELAYATRALRAREQKFKEAVTFASATAKKFDSNGLCGYEAALGSDTEFAADKARRIFASTFDISADVRIPIDRD